MGQSTTSNSTPINNAAKDDVVTEGVSFTIADLLSNDPGGAAKVDVANQFFFGDSADDQGAAGQAAYMTLKGIVLNADGTYTAEQDFSYFVQIGNKGTWSIGDVTVEDAPVEVPCEPVAINGSFEGVAAETVNDWVITNVTGWNNTGNESGGQIEVWDAAGLLSRTGLAPTEGNLVIETDSSGSLSPDPILVQDNYVFDLGTSTVAGENYELSFDFAARSDLPGFVSGTTDQFEVFWNDDSLGIFDPLSSTWVSSAPINVTSDGSDTLTIRELGANDGYGAVVDNFQLMTMCPCDCNSDLVIA